jgi:hypothetical protein
MVVKKALLKATKSALAKAGAQDFAEQGKLALVANERQLGSFVKSAQDDTCKKVNKKSPRIISGFHSIKT